ncbi:hypothetical protein C8Q76DRAFT_604248 [Earliella scabrosa]|nr:hypothetical protein C8Q76DRAFT_604248 [Earliella scabrosa]
MVLQCTTELIIIAPGYWCFVIQKWKLLVHALVPFHRILLWDHQHGFWQKVDAEAVGLRLYTGHQGNRCPHISRAPRRMVIVHEHGIHKIPVSFCECITPLSAASPIQLLRLGLYPGTWTSPRTAFTLNVMKDYHLLSLQANVSAQDFHTYLTRCTDNIDTFTEQDRYREFMASMREFSFLRACKRGGQVPSRTMPSRSLAVLCPACPQPGMNMRPGWERRDRQYAYLDALFYAIDGNYHQHQRKKRMDPNDFALSLGAAYFANELDFHKYVSAMGEVPPEESTCNKFGAIGPGGYTHPVSGILALSCRHELIIPQSIIDLVSNEKYWHRAYIVDFAVVSGTQPYIRLTLFKQYYDVNCQYMVRFPLRMKHMDQHLVNMTSIHTVDLPEIQGAVPAFHQYAHREQCQSFQSPNCLPGSGKYDGETNERKWNQTNRAALRSREMSSGARHDFLNDLLSDLNVRNVHNMAQTLVHKHEEATKQWTLAQEYLNSIEEGIPLQVLCEWRREEAEWLSKVVDIKTHKTLDNPFVTPKDSVLSKMATSDVLKTPHGQEIGGYSLELVGAIEGMMDLERERFNLLDKIYLTDPTKARQCSAMAARVAAFVSKAEICHDIYGRYVNPIVTQAADVRDSGPVSAVPTCLPWREPADDARCGVTARAAPVRPVLRDTMLLALVAEVNEVDIYLPSLYHSLIRRHTAMTPLVLIERRLREGQAHDALDDLRLQIMARYSVKDLDEQGAGQAHGKRIRELDETYQKAANKARDEYRRLRDILLLLGLGTDDPKLRELTDDDCKTMGENRKRGESRTQRSWLWADLSVLSKDMESGVKGYMIKHSRAHWFRCSAAAARWKEEVYLKREEMFSTLLFFMNNARVWQARAAVEKTGGRMGATVFALRQAHRWIRLFDAAQSIFPADIHEVSPKYTKPGWQR